MGVLQYAVVGIMVGSIYGLVASGVVIIVKTTKVFNFAVGEMLLLTGFCAWSFTVSLKWPFWVSALVAILIGCILGLVIERLAMRPLIGEPIVALFIATLGLGIFLRGACMLIWGATTVGFPLDTLPGRTLRVGGLVLSHELLWAFFVGLFGFAGLTWFFNKTKRGVVMRAAADDIIAVQAMGISGGKVQRVSWALAGVLAAFGGIILGNRIGLGVTLTPELVLKVFPVLFLGGLDSIGGAMLAGIIIGVIENLAGGLLDPSLSEITPYIILIVVLMVRPEGLFGSERIERV